MPSPLKSLDYDHGYLWNRGLTVASVKTFGVGYCSRGLMKGRIAVPIHNERGELRPHSDVDLLVVFDADARIGLIALGRLQRGPRFATAGEPDMAQLAGVVNGGASREAPPEWRDLFGLRAAARSRLRFSVS